MTKRLAALILIAVLAAALIPSVTSADSAWTMYVYTDNGKTLNVRSDPMTGNNIIGRLNYGDAVSVRMTLVSGWACIDWPSSGTGVAYVQTRFLVPAKPAPKPGGNPQPAPAETSDAAKVLAAMNREFASAKRVSPYTVIARPARASGWVNLRWAPTTEAERIATCRQGKELIVLAELLTWYQVQDPATGMIGFISASYVARK